MLQAGPEILRNSSDLDLHLGFYRTLRQVNGNGHHHMIALIAIWLWLTDIVLHIEDRNILLACDHIRNLVNVLVKGTDDADACNVAELFYHVFYGHLIAIALHFLDDAVRGLHPGFDVFNGRVPIHMNELFV